MYEYRKLTSEEKAELVQYSLSRGYPSHSPPHQVKDEKFYLLTAACYEHKFHMHSESRRQQLLDIIFERFINSQITICAWAVLPNHYHLLVHVIDFDVLSKLFRGIHGLTSRQWNLEENVTKRKVWYRWSDRAIRSERHYYTTVNYIHYNPVKHALVKHALVKSPYEWVETSVHWYLQAYGQQWLRDAWIEYPILDYGSTWDE